MRIHILSDIHLEFGPFEPPRTNADIVVLAGDIGLGANGIEWANRAFPDTPVVYVPGNHEFYHQEIRTALDAMHRAAGDMCTYSTTTVSKSAGCDFSGRRSGPISISMAPPAGLVALGIHADAHQLAVHGEISDRLFTTTKAANAVRIAVNAIGGGFLTETLHGSHAHFHQYESHHMTRN